MQYVLLSARESFIAGLGNESLVFLVADMPQYLAADSGCPWMTILCLSVPASAEGRPGTSLRHKEGKTLQLCALLRPSCGCCSGSTYWHC